MVETASSDLVVIRGVGKRFPGVVANHDVDITIRAGSVHALIGENGAGKSTLMKILYGVQKPDEGTIAINGEQVTFHSPTDAIEHGIGMVFQHFMLADNLTVLENVVLGAEKLHGIGVEARRTVSEISATYGFGIDPTVLAERLGCGRPAAGGDPEGSLPRSLGSSSSTSRRRSWCRRRSTRSSPTCATSRPRDTPSCSSPTSWTRCSRSLTTSRSCDAVRPWGRPSRPRPRSVSSPS